MSRGPYMKRPITTWAPPSVQTASLRRWFAVTFWGRRDTGDSVTNLDAGGDYWRLTLILT